MSAAGAGFGKQFVAAARHCLEEQYGPRITRCLELLSEEDIWWRPHSTSNSVGNLVLHLSGNVRQWIISGLGGAPDVRERDQEFAELGPIPRPALVARLEETVAEAGGVLGRLTARDLERERVIQGFRVTGFKAIFHIAEHFAYHAGQIILITKLRRGEDLGFTRLPGEKSKATRLPPI
jgi:uncharacterized damage-inducible protein DinB